MQWSADRGQVSPAVPDPPFEQPVLDHHGSATEDQVPQDLRHCRYRPRVGIGHDKDARVGPGVVRVLKRRRQHPRLVEHLEVDQIRSDKDSILPNRKRHLSWLFGACATDLPRVDGVDTDGPEQSSRPFDRSSSR